MSHRSAHVSRLLAGTLFAASLALLPGPEPAGAAGISPPPTPDELKHATYTGIGTVPIRLSGGSYAGPPYVSGGASRQRVELLDSAPCAGDLNGDGTAESVVFLSEENGGTATMLHMAVMGRTNGAVATIAAVPVGERVSVRSVKLENSQITLEILQAGPKDPACCPSELVTRTWMLERVGLVESGTRKRTGVLKLATVEGVEWLLRPGSLPSPPGAPVVSLRFDRERISGDAGCNRYAGSAAPAGLPGELTLKAVKATNRECPAAVMNQEQQFLQALRRTVRYGFYLGDLALTWQKEDGSLGLLRFALGKKADR